MGFQSKRKLCWYLFALSVHFLLVIKKLKKLIVRQSKFDNVCAVDCSGASVTGAGRVTYTIPTPAFQGSTMPVTCLPGYVWNVAPFNGSQNATCVNASSTAQWSILGNPTCVGMRREDYQYFTVTGSE